MSAVEEAMTTTSVGVFVCARDLPQRDGVYQI